MNIPTSKEKETYYQKSTDLHRFLKTVSRRFVTLLIIGAFLIDVIGCQTSATSKTTDPQVAVADTMSLVGMNSSQGKESETDSSFARYLQCFSEVHPLDQWPEDALDPLVMHNEIWDEDKAKLNFVLKYTYHKIDPVLYRFIPTGKIKRLTDEAPENVDPRLAYDFYGFAKVKHGSNWLVSLLAMKLRREDAVYHRHPFLLATYSENGSLVEDFVWWTIVDDDIQVYEDVDVRGDTLLIGKKENINDSELSKVYEKVLVSKSGKFKTIFSQYPDGYLRH